MAGAAIRRFTLDKIRRFEILVPPIELQKSYELVIKNIQRQKDQITLESTNQLFNSLIQKAFNGELIS